MQRILLFLFLSSVGNLRAQTIYFNDIQGNIYSFNIQTCASVQISNGPAFNDMAVGANGLLYGLVSADVYEIDPVAGTSILVGSVPPNNFVTTGLEYGQDGLVYIIGTEVWALNPATGTIVNNGALPNSWFSIGDLVYYNGQYYATVYELNTGSNDQLVIIDLANPANSTSVGPLPNSFLVAGASVFNTSCPKMYWFETISLVDPSVLWEYDINTQTWTTICPNFNFTVGGADTPNDYSFAIPCACVTDAGTPASGTLNTCVGSPATSGGNLNVVLDNDDVLQYILFTDPNDTLGSIIMTGNTLFFDYNPAIISPNVVYYIAAIAGNNLNGQVDQNDPCLSISNAMMTVWRPLPTLSWQSNIPNACSGDCIPLSLTLGGTPPFTLSYNNPFSGTGTQTFFSNQESWTVCIPPGSPVGSFQLEAISLSDAWCTCP